MGLSLATFHNEDNAITPRTLKKCNLSSRFVAEPPEGTEFSRETNESVKGSGPILYKHVMKTDKSIDKSVVGDFVIIVGLTATFLVAIFCYIPVNRKKAVESSSPSSSFKKKDAEPGLPTLVSSNLIITSQ
ncbi:Unknown protein [Striga hermonthica]|uniref:Uncharacterized protein n=1 Tax=Striga hermonthica TaxID=68872 RepID=A0A9N7P3H6_STRHE|nr:Unknown protein [Striga hermonthica]